MMEDWALISIWVALWFLLCGVAYWWLWDETKKQQEEVKK